MIALATAIALLDLLFILLAVPESLPERMRPVSWGAPITWEQADPFNVSLFMKFSYFPQYKQNFTLVNKLIMDIEEEKLQISCVQKSQQNSSWVKHKVCTSDNIFLHDV